MMRGGNVPAAGIEGSATLQDSCGPTRGAQPGDEQEETVDEVLERMGFTRTHWLLFLVTGLVWSADAMSVMLMSFLGPAVSTIVPVTRLRFKFMSMRYA